MSLIWVALDDSNLSYFKYEGSNKITSKLEPLGCAPLSEAELVEFC